MNREVMEKWVTALRSGDYGQTRAQLRATVLGKNHHRPKENAPSGRFCCLGVLCNLFAEEHPEAKWAIHPRFGSCHFYPSGVDAGWDAPDCDDEMLPVAVKVWAGMYTTNGLTRPGLIGPIHVESAAITRLRKLVPANKREGIISLSGANDSGATFEQIADFIEQNWQDL